VGWQGFDIHQACKPEEENGKAAAVSFKFCFLNPWNSLEAFRLSGLIRSVVSRLLQVDPPWNYILLIGSLNHLSGWFFSWLNHLSLTELANKLACCCMVRADALLSTCKTHSFTAYARKLEAKVLVSDGPVGCFPKLLSDHRKLVYSGLLLVSNWLCLFATMYRVARNTTGPVCYQKNSKEKAQKSDCSWKNTQWPLFIGWVSTLHLHSNSCCRGEASNKNFAKQSSTKDSVTAIAWYTSLSNVSSW
jgi:hypothetical protein